MTRVELDDVRAAAERLRGLLQVTPLLAWRSPSTLVKAAVRPLWKEVGR